MVQSFYCGWLGNGLIFKDTTAGSLLELGEPVSNALMPLQASEDQWKDEAQIL